MSKRSGYESFEIMQRKISMSQQIADKDADYGLYSGARLEDALTMALLDTIKDDPRFKGMKTQITWYRGFLDKKRKAFFASMSSELSQLGFILGLKDERVTGKNTREELDKLSKGFIQ